MKLYTEEQVKQLLFDLGDALFNNCQNGIKEETPEKYSQTLLKDTTPIELPSDDEIHKQSTNYSSLYYEFRAGAQWVIEQIKNQQK